MSALALAGLSNELSTFFQSNIFNLQSMNQTQEDFFDMLSRLQSKRMDEQRCAAPILNDISNRPSRQRDSTAPSPNG